MGRGLQNPNVNMARSIINFCATVVIVIYYVILKLVLAA
jgi:hypothetical protein